MTRVPELDGLRGIAILLVLTAHLIGLNGAGLVGVLIFFVLSGYLITSILIREHVERSRVDFRVFYMRRALRLLPALAFLVALVLALALLGVGVSDTTVALRGALQAGLYATNFAVGLDQEFAPELAHLWTLAVEEQFYVAWPVVLVLILRVARSRGDKQIRWIVWLLAAGVLARLVTILLSQEFGWFFYALPTTWLDCFMAGALLATWTVSRSSSLRQPRWVSALPTSLSILTITAVSLHPGAFLSSTTYVLGVPILTAATVCLIGRAVLHPPDTYHGLLRMAPIQWLGDRSYGLYLFNSTCVLTAAVWLGSGLASRSAGILAAVVLAEVSRRFIERPALRLRSRASDHGVEPDVRGAHERITG